jgi:Histidine kinase
MPTSAWAAPTPAENAVQTTAAAPAPSRMAIWRAVQLGVAVGGTTTFIITSGVFAAYPDLTASDRWQIALQIAFSKFATVALQLPVLHAFARLHAAALALRVLRFTGMVLLGTVGGSAPMILLADVPSIRLGVMESAGTGIWSTLFGSLLIATFLVYQHEGQARSEEASRRLQQLQREQRAARRRLVEAQLRAMQARVDPQMFFDVLDAVQRLYATDAARAEALLDELIVFLRAALPRLRNASSTVAQELELAASYFRLQSLGGDTKAGVHIDLPDALAARAFPAGVILPLLTDARDAAIEVQARPGAGADDLTVSLRAERAPAPNVLSQVRETLAALYGSSATLECHATAPEACIETRITIAHATV